MRLESFGYCSISTTEKDALDLLFTISGLLLTASAASFLRREAGAFLRLTMRKPRHLYAVQVPVHQEQVLADLKHFARRNHLTFALAETENGPAMILKSRTAKSLLFAIYFAEHSATGCGIEIGATHLDQTPYLFFRKKHAEAAKAVAKHLQTSWERRRYLDLMFKK